jgi:hypothetical protein
MPTKRLPDSPSLDHLKHQAKDLLRTPRDPQTCQRIREFHPQLHQATDQEIGAAKLTLADAQLTIAREYGFKSWPRLKAHVEQNRPPDFDLPHHERIEDPLFRHAVDLLDAGDAAGLQDHLSRHPHLATQRVVFEGGNYFQNPSLLEFIAENPVRHDRLPPNIVEVAKVILEAGAKFDQRGLDYTLSLVCSGRVPREQGVQTALIDLLCHYGADPNDAMNPALGHGEFEAVDALIRRGAEVDLPTATALGDTETAKQALPQANPQERHLAVVYAAMHGRPDILKLLLDAGEDPNRYNPVGAHSHSVPLHQAVASNHDDVVRLLVESGARLDLKDTLYQSTPLGWAEFMGRHEIADYLRRCEKR